LPSCVEGLIICSLGISWEVVVSVARSGWIERPCIPGDQSWMLVHAQNAGLALLHETDIREFLEHLDASVAMDR
jgi:hypothetical protein